MRVFDVVIVGGGPAGLSAALLLGRARRRVLVVDAGRPRNRYSHAMHGFLSRDGADPADLLRLAREQLRPYRTVEFRQSEVTDAVRLETSFRVTLAGGGTCESRLLLLATGVEDEWPRIEGAEPLYGSSIHHCPYCDGWEVRDQPLAAYGHGRAGYGLALELLGWSDDVVLCTDGPARLDARNLDRLARLGIALHEERIARVEGRAGVLKRIVFATGEALPRRALFFMTSQRQRSDLAARLGCDFTRRGSIRSDREHCTSIPGLYVAGDADRNVQLVIIAAAEGARAAFAMNTVLLREDLRERERRSLHD
jgi:thioredoxin reductase